MIKKRITLLAITILFLSSCDLFNEDSDEIASENIYISAEITAKGGYGTLIKVNLHKGKALGKAIELVNGDKLTVHYLGDSVTLKKDDNLLEIDYRGIIENQGNAGRYTLIFERYDGSRISSTVDMPEPFNIDSPKVNSIFNQGDSVEVTWSPISLLNSMDFHGHLSCQTFEDDWSADIDNENEDWVTLDDGLFLLPLDHLISNLAFEVAFEDERFNYSVPCSLDFDMSRSNYTDLSGQYANDSIMTATQYRKVGSMSVWLFDD